MNKKILLSILVFALGIFTIQAQQSRYGFRLGANYSDIDFDDDSTGIVGDSDARIGFVAGFFGQFPLSEKFSLEVELQYSAQGERSKVVFENPQGNGTTATNTRVDDRLKVNVLQLPILLNYEVASKFVFSLGPQVGIRIWEFERTDDYETIQFSAVGGIGYNITDNVTANLRLSYGLSDAIKTDDNESIFNATGVNHYAQFTLAYRL